MPSIAVQRQVRRRWLSDEPRFVVEFGSRMSQAGWEFLGAEAEFASFEWKRDLKNDLIGSVSILPRVSSRGYLNVSAKLFVRSSYVYKFLHRARYFEIFKAKHMLAKRLGTVCMQADTRDLTQGSFDGNDVTIDFRNEEFDLAKFDEWYLNFSLVSENFFSLANDVEGLMNFLISNPEHAYAVSSILMPNGFLPAALLAKQIGKIDVARRLLAVELEQRISKAIKYNGNELVEPNTMAFNELAIEIEK